MGCIRLGGSVSIFTIQWKAKREREIPTNKRILITPRKVPPHQENSARILVVPRLALVRRAVALGRAVGEQHGLVDLEALQDGALRSRG